MEVRIDVIDAGGQRVVVVEGRLAGEAVEQLEATVRSLAPPVRLSLGHLISVDDAGLEWLRACRERGFEFEEVRGLIAHRLEENTEARRRP